MDDRRFYYTVDQKALGPLSGRAMLRLVERGILSEPTMVCEDGKTWLWLLESSLKEQCQLLRGSFYVGDGVEFMKFPQLRRKFENGDIDGLTQVYWGEKWQALAEVPHLRDVLTGTDSFESLQNREEFIPPEEDDEDEQPPQEEPKEEAPLKRKRTKRKKQNFDAGKCWIYVENLPSDCTLEELQAHFKKCGVLAMDPETLDPKIKLYKDVNGILKGDAAICYANDASVQLAVDILDGGSLRYGWPLKVSKADFGEARLGKYDASKRKKLHSTKLKIAKQAAKQLTDWDHDDDAPEADGLRIIVVEGLAHDDEASILQHFERPPEKITVFPQHSVSPVVIKLHTPADAQDAITSFNTAGLYKAHFWDGVTNYAASPVDDVAESKRLDDFGDWLENQGDLPPELQPRLE